MKSDRELLEILNDIPDPREKRGVRYRYARSSADMYIRSTCRIQ